MLRIRTYTAVSCDSYTNPALRTELKRDASIVQVRDCPTSSFTALDAPYIRTSIPALTTSVTSLNRYLTFQALLIWPFPFSHANFHYFERIEICDKSVLNYRWLKKSVLLHGRQFTSSTQLYSTADRSEVLSNLDVHSLSELAALKSTVFKRKKQVQNNNSACLLQI